MRPVQVLLADAAQRWLVVCGVCVDAASVWQAVVKKKLAIDEWLASVRGGTTLSRSISLADMFNPQVFLNALRQQTSRSSQPPVAVDDLKLVCVWGESAARSMGALPCALSGLSLQGGLFTAGGTLSDARADTPTVLPPPIPNCVATCGRVCARTRGFVLPRVERQASGIGSKRHWLAALSLLSLARSLSLSPSLPPSLPPAPPPPLSMSLPQKLILMTANRWCPCQRAQSLTFRRMWKTRSRTHQAWCCLCTRG